MPPDFTSQARLAWSHVIAQLGAAGMSVENLAKVSMFLSSREFADLNSEVRNEFLGSHAPALTVIVTGIFDPRWLLEIDAYAVARLLLPQREASGRTSVLRQPPTINGQSHA